MLYPAYVLTTMCHFNKLQISVKTNNVSVFHKKIGVPLRPILLSIRTNKLPQQKVHNIFQVQTSPFETYLFLRNDIILHAYKIVFVQKFVAAI